MMTRCVVIVLIVFVFTITVWAGSQEAESEESTECRYTLTKKKSAGFDVGFWKKFFKHWNPFKSNRSKMYFYLFKKNFANCGRELITGNDEMLEMSGIDARHPTRIIIHGWMSQSRGSHNRKLKNAYLSLTKPVGNENSTEFQPARYEDFNIIVCDWSMVSTNANYFGVAASVEDLGALLADFVRYLHQNAGLQFDDIYVIGHSLGAQIAGSAGKQLRPDHQFNTIFALDPAGPEFRDQTEEYRIDASDARYVESIQTSTSFGFEKPVGHATFYPNFGKNQRKCYFYGCSHKRAHKYFEESIISSKGFWGTRCERPSADVWVLLDNEPEERMGGEPSVPKNGTFYVKTNAEPPYAMGRQRNVDQQVLSGNSNDTSKGQLQVEWS